ncbi:hypothetical protein JCM10212_001817 [Sporobolomyces blumeae]
MPARRTKDVTLEPDDGEHESLRSGFNEMVYRVVRRIPEGKVASYGTIAKLIGHPRHSRMVGTALKVLPHHMASPYLPPAPRSSSGESTASTASSQSASSTAVASTANVDANPFADLADDLDDDVLPAPQLNPDWVPWHRVVSSTGVISPRGNDRAVRRQADYLVAEGVQVRDGARAGGGGASHERHGGGVDAFGLGGVSGGRVSMSTYGWKG